MEELSLRVSVGVLVKVLFNNPKDRRTIERTAALRQFEGHTEVRVRAKPFEGARDLSIPKH